MEEEEKTPLSRPLPCTHLWPLVSRPGFSFPSGGESPSEKAAAKSKAPVPSQQPRALACSLRPSEQLSKAVRMDRQLLMLRMPVAGQGGVCRAG